MVAGLIVFVLTAFAASGVIGVYAPRNYRQQRDLLRIFFFHFLLSTIYYLYVLYNPSDSYAYYYSATSTEDWFTLYGTSTTFIKFIHFPFGHYLSFSYEASMVLFSFFGYLGFLFLYLAFNEQLVTRPKLWGLDLVTLVFFLPNLHFWSGSLGKGSVIVFGIGLLIFGLSDFRKRILYILLGSVIIYHVRPHIMLIMLISFGVSFVFTTRGISWSWRLLFLIGSVSGLFFIYQDVLTLIGIDEEQMLSQGLDLTHRATELSKATSGVDITNYSLPLQVFTFLYRPLFFDAPGALGLFVSFENVFYMVMTIVLLSRASGWKYMLRGTFLSKGSFLSFLMVSVALAQVSGNLGLAIRQKSQVMILFLFVVLAFLDDEKRKAIRVRKNRIQRRKSMPMEFHAPWSANT